MSPKADAVCISGIGVVSPHGTALAEHRAVLSASRQPASWRISGFKASDHIKRRYLRPLDDVTVRCIAMAADAVRDTGVDMQQIDGARIGIVIGSMYAGIGCIFDFKQTCHEGRDNGYLGLSPLYFPGIVFNSLSGQAAIEFAYTGPNAVVNAGLSSGLLAVIKGIEYIRSGQADVVIAGGAEMWHPFLHERFEVRRADERISAMDAGFALSEAVCLFVLHRADDVRFQPESRYARIGAWRYGFLPGGQEDHVLNDALSRLAGDATVDTAVTSGGQASRLYALERRVVDQAFGGSVTRWLSNGKSFGQTLGASSSLNLLHALFDLKDKANGGDSTLIHATDPGGSYALMTVRQEPING